MSNLAVFSLAETRGCPPGPRTTPPRQPARPDFAKQTPGPCIASHMRPIPVVLTTALRKKIGGHGRAPAGARLFRHCALASPSAYEGARQNLRCFARPWPLTGDASLRTYAGSAPVPTQPNSISKARILGMGPPPICRSMNSHNQLLHLTKPKTGLTLMLVRLMTLQWPWDPTRWSSGRSAKARCRCAQNQTNFLQYHPNRGQRPESTKKVTQAT